jgi:hypothetical protein
MKLMKACFALGVVLSASAVLGQVTGSGTKATIPVWTGKTTLGNSPIYSTGGNVGIGTKTFFGRFDVTTTSTTKPAIFGNNSATSGNTDGVFGQVASPNGNGVIGINNAISGYAVGVTGITNSPGGAGLNGFSFTKSGGIGVTGAAATSGIAVFGVNQFCSGSTCNPVAGTAALFVTGTGGTIIVGQTNGGSGGVNVFRVDDTGKGFFDGGTQTGGADFAESVAVAKEFTKHEPGDLLIVDTTGKRQLKLSSEPYSTLVAGIYSTKPGVLATPHKMVETVANEIPLAIVGIVPCKVSAENGAIQPGDLLVASSTPGHAMKGTDRSRMLGAVVGKALEPLNEGRGVIQVLVTLQ